MKAERGPSIYGTGHISGPQPRNAYIPRPSGGPHRAFGQPLATYEQSDPEERCLVFMWEYPEFA